jgi:hypothetical protein
VLREWANYQKPAWQWIELVNFNNNPGATLSTDEITSEVWMTIIHGRRDTHRDSTDHLGIAPERSATGNLSVGSVGSV